MIRRLLPITLMLVASLAAADKPNEQLSGVHSLYIAGNNQAAEKAREDVQKGKTCFALATKPEDADATLEMEADGKADPSVMGEFGRRTWVVSANLKLKSGDLVWSKSERFDDAPFMSGAKTAGSLLVKRLQKACGCSK